VALDPFLHEVVAAKQSTDEQVAAATCEYQRELDARFSYDVQVKERLSRFAREHELDRALIALWEEIQHYPSWAQRKDFGNKLKLASISGSHEKDVQSVEFTSEGQRFILSARTFHGMEGESYADFSFWEDGTEVFAITYCTRDEYGFYDSGGNVDAFKKRGNWAKVLLRLYSQIQIERNKSRADSKYFGADKIKSRFEE